VNLVHGRLKQSSPDFELYVAPTVTTSAGDYLKELGAAIPQDVLFFRSSADANLQAREWGALANRRPVLWVNFAANDDGPGRLFRAAKRGATPTLSEDANGFLATAMREPRASMLPIATAADYAWDSRNYNPQQSFDRALNLLYDERARAVVRIWAKVSGDAA